MTRHVIAEWWNFPRLLSVEYTLLESEMYTQGAGLLSGAGKDVVYP